MAEKKLAYHYATGRRKTAVAQVRLYPQGNGKVTINEKVVVSEGKGFLAPLTLVGLSGADLSVKVHGGGTAGQEEAIRHGIARAIVVMDEEYKTTLRKAGYLTRDPREKERKKPGLKGARRRPQWSKR
ncbi:MAG TPA: 30S ribosomal protein S9 [Verrucomicrobiae bacterium]|nr:30S ribosomal protein S9 [Verrucomicrobiae bacterium]